MIQDRESKKFMVGPRAYLIGSIYQSNNDPSNKISANLNVGISKGKIVSISNEPLSG